MSIYDRIPAIINGVEFLARPFEFEFNDKGEPIKATRFETTDPLSGALIQFGLNDVTWDGEKAIYGTPALVASPRGQVQDPPIKQVFNYKAKNLDTKSIPPTPPLKPPTHGRPERKAVAAPRDELRRVEDPKRAAMLLKNRIVPMVAEAVEVHPFIDPIEAGLFQIK